MTFSMHSITKLLYGALFIAYFSFSGLSWSNNNEHQNSLKSMPSSDSLMKKGEVKVLENVLHFPKTQQDRTLRIYFPPSYNNDLTKRYPVLYMHDAQNIFDEKTSYAGEWGIDESMDKLANTHGLEVIIVGIDNHPKFRLNEYSAWSHDKYGAGMADTFMEDIVNTLKPHIDASYRTLPNRMSTGMMGSSLGGLATHYALVEHSKVFGLAGVFSPSYWYAPAAYQYTQNSDLALDAKWYFYAGGQESESMVDEMQKMIEQMRTQGVPANNIQYKVLENGEHNEKFWRAEFPAAVLWLFNSQ